MNYEQLLFLIGIPAGLIVLVGGFKFIMWLHERNEK
jgi:hypothetical protein